MILTHRRRNLCEAYIIANREWATIEQLQAAGAYGSAQSIHRAMRKLMLKEEGAMVTQFKTDEGKSVTRYKITHTGMISFGRIPSKRDL